MMLSIESVMTMLMASSGASDLSALLWIMFIYNVIGVYLNCKAYSLLQKKAE